MVTIVYIALGSNQGDRQAHLAAALADLRAARGVSNVTQSPTYETDPVGGPVGQGKFLNSVAVVNTELTPEELLVRLHQIEIARGRDRDTETQRCGPRPLDLDILLFGNQIIGHPDPASRPSDTRPPIPDTRSSTPPLTVPHPRMHLRWFVLKPLCDIAPDAVHPIFKRTARELLAELEMPAR